MKLAIRVWVSVKERENRKLVELLYLPIIGVVGDVRYLHVSSDEVMVIFPESTSMVDAVSPRGKILVEIIPLFQPSHWTGGSPWVVLSQSLKGKILGLVPGVEVDCVIVPRGVTERDPLTPLSFS